jgi:cell division transport system permease protein
MLIGEALRSIRASASTTLAATMTVLIGMFLLGLLIALGSWVVSWSENVKKEVVVKVFFCTTDTCGQEATPAQINGVRAKLEGDPRVRKVTFVSKDEALARMKERFPDLFQGGLVSNPLPASEEVELKRAEDADDVFRSLGPYTVGADDSLGGRTTRFQTPGVETVSYGEKTAKRIIQVARVIEIVFLLAVIILFVASTLLIANTIRLSIFARRREIEVMKLVGATNWFVRGPFMLEGLLCGLVGSLMAVVLLLLGKELALPAILGQVGDGDEVKALAFWVNALLLIAAGLMLGAAGSGLTLRRFLKV